jgi:peroxiredoxin
MAGELPRPVDDGSADHLPGKSMPAIELPATDGSSCRLDQLPARSVVFVYPSIGGPGKEELLEDWTAIPGARGCTPEACSFRDDLAEFEALGVSVSGLSGEAASAQANHARELQLPYRLVSDESLQLSEAIELPTFEFDGRRFYRRLTLVLSDGAIEAALYPVFPPDQAAAQALEWLRHPSAGTNIID